MPSPPPPRRSSRVRSSPRRTSSRWKLHDTYATVTRKQYLVKREHWNGDDEDVGPPLAEEVGERAARVEERAERTKRAEESAERAYSDFLRWFRRGTMIIAFDSRSRSAKG
jgi:hypothetical protein